MAGTFSDSKGLITVPFASGTAWDCAEKSGSQAGAEALLVRCRSKAPGEFFFMMAKDYTVPKEQVMAADKLATTVYKRDYEKFFKTVKYTKTGPVKQGRLQWYELAFQAEHAAKGPIHKVERVLVKGTHVLLLSAEGAPKDFAAHQVDTGRWLSKTAFATLK
jgi:ethanolamine ammonia-lyase small subunit